MLSNSILFKMSETIFLTISETIKQLLCNCRALSRLKLKTPGRGFFEGLNSVPRTDIIHRFIVSLCWLISARALAQHFNGGEQDLSLT